MLREDILGLAAHVGLDRDCGIDATDDHDTALAKLDNHLCELKEMQIRGGLHVFGRAPEGETLHDLLVAMVRLPRGDTEPADASLVRALAADLDLGDFDPLSAHLGERWRGPRPGALAGLRLGPTGHVAHSVERGERGHPARPGRKPAGDDPPKAGDCSSGRDARAPGDAARDTSLDRKDDGPSGRRDAPAPWRTCGDTVERLEHLARRLVEGTAAPEPGWTRTRAVLEFVERDLRPRVVASGPAELDACRHALDARFLSPGPSGAPTRGRLDVLPTGRNFYSVDTRTVPTPAAWKLGWKSAALLLERYRQEHGAWPKRIALSAWGTANMRTGGDDIAQALALMGVKPTWEVASGRVTGFEVLPLDLLDRPRVDVTLRISGFFRDAFPSQIDLFDSAVRAVAALDETERFNPLAARTRRRDALG